METPFTSGLHWRLYNDVVRQFSDGLPTSIEILYSTRETTKVVPPERRIFSRRDRKKFAISSIRYTSHDEISDSYLKFLSNVLDNRVSD